MKKGGNQNIIREQTLNLTFFGMIAVFTIFLRKESADTMLYLNLFKFVFRTDVTKFTCFNVLVIITTVKHSYIDELILTVKCFSFSVTF